MDVKNVQKWVREFMYGCTDVHDEQRSGRPSVSAKTIANVEKEMLEDRAIQNRRRGMLTKGVCFYHDYAHPHTAHATADLLDQFGWDILTYPPSLLHSQHLAPSDFHLFPELKSHFQTNDELKKRGRALPAQSNR